MSFLQLRFKQLRNQGGRNSIAFTVDGLIVGRNTKTFTADGKVAIAINRLTNPNFEGSVDGGVLFGYWNGQVSIDTSKFLRGASSLKVHSPDAINPNGMINMTNVLLPSGTQIKTQRGWIWVPTGTTVRVGNRINDHTGSYAGEETVAVNIVGNNTWQEFVLGSWTYTGDASGFYPGLQAHLSSAASGIDFWMDECILSLESTLYFDGDSTNSEWQGSANASLSSIYAARTAKTFTADGYVSALTETFKDRFDEISLPAQWNDWSSGHATLVNNQLVLSSQVSSTNYYGIDSSVNTYILSLVGSYVQAQLVNAGNQALVSWEVHVVTVNTYATGNPMLTFFVSNGNIVARYHTSSSNNDTSAAYDANVHKWFRIRESGGTLFWDYSTDGFTWVNFKSLATPAAFDPLRVWIGTQVGTYQSEASGTSATIDNFNVVRTNKTFTVDGIIFATNTKTFTADGIVKVLNNTKTFTADGIVLVHQTKTFTADGIVKVLNNTKTFTADGIVKVLNNVKTFTADGIVLVRTTKTFTADGIVKVLNNTKTFTADGIVFATNTKTFTVDGIVKVTVGLDYSLTFDGSQNYVSLGTMGNFGQNLGKGFYARFELTTTDTAIAEFGRYPGFPVTNSTFGIMFNEDRFNSNVSGALGFYLIDNNNNELLGNTGNVNFNDGNKHVIEISANPATNTIVIKVDGVSKSITYRFQQTPSTFSNFASAIWIGGHNESGGNKFLSGKLDNLVLGTGQDIAEIYGSYNFNDGSGTTLTDQSGNNNNGTLTGSPKPVWTLNPNSFTVDGIVLVHTTKTFTADGIVRATQTKTFTADGIVKTLNNPKTFTADGIVKVLNNIKTFTADGIVKVLNNLKTFTVDGIIFATNTKTFTVDGDVFATNKKTFTADGIVFATNTKTFTADGIIVDTNATTKTKTFTADGIIFATNLKTFTADGIVKVLNNNKTFTADGIVQVRGNLKTFTADGIVRVTTTKTFTADGIVKVLNNVFTFTADGIVKVLNNQKTFTVDGIVQTRGNLKTFTADGVVQTRGNLKTFTVDADIREFGEIKTFTVDGIIFATNTKSFTVDGIVSVGQTKYIFTADGIIAARNTVAFTVDAIINPTKFTAPGGRVDADDWLGHNTHSDGLYSKLEANKPLYSKGAEISPIHEQDEAPRLVDNLEKWGNIFEGDSVD